MQRWIIGPASHGDDRNILLVTLGLSIVIENALLAAFRSDTRSIDVPYGFSSVDLGFVFLPMPRVIAFGVTCGVALLLWALLTRTDAGKAIRAVAKEKLGAALVGIDVPHVYALTFGIGAACLAVAACVLLPSYYVHPRVGNAYVLIAFTVVVLGGMGSVPGAHDRRPLHRRRGEPVGPLFRREPRPARRVRDLHPGAAGASDGTVRSARMSAPRKASARQGLLAAYGPILAVAAVLALLPLATSANTVLNAMVLALLIALAGQGWNILGGYGGQFSFGHAAFFGTGAYAPAILQARLGVNAYAAFAAAVATGAAGRRGDRLSQLPLRPARLLLRARDPGLRGGVPDHRQCGAVHRRRAPAR